MGMYDNGVNAYGMLLDKEAIELICRRVFQDDEDANGLDLYDEGICESIGEFSGEFYPIGKDGLDDMWSDLCESYQGDQIFYVQIKEPSLFKKAYDSIDDIVRDLKERVGEYLPTDYDYESKIGHFVGTYWG